jgi:Cu2+-exporting ATPase
MGATTQHFEIPLLGVHNEHCAHVVDHAISEIRGITAHRVDVNNETAFIEFEENSETLSNVVEKIRSSGYDVAVAKKIFTVTNMSCASCAVNVESIIKGEPGILSASVNYANGDALLEFIPGITNLQHLKAEVQSTGYDILIKEEENAEELKDEIKKDEYLLLKTKTIWAISLSLPVAVLGMSLC